MKDRLTDANFPRTADGRVYHLGVRAGEVANRIITVGSPSRAEGIAAHFDPKPPVFRLASERGFLTLTGRFGGVPVSVVSIGMGYPNVDFFVREVRECVRGDMVVVRLGSCGCLLDVPVGTIVVPKASVAVTRNYDYDFIKGEGDGPPYRISKPISADPELHDAVFRALESSKPKELSSAVLGDTVNASADSFYSTQGRITSFPDHNADLIDTLLASVPKLATFEMETFHIFHLAASWPRSPAAPEDTAAPRDAPPVATSPVAPSIAEPPGPASGSRTPPIPRGGAIKAAAAQMVFAARTSREFISPEDVALAEAWCGRAVLEAVAGFAVDEADLHEEAGSVWEVRGA